MEQRIAFTALIFGCEENSVTAESSGNGRPLAGRNAIVTGAARGIGLAIACRLAEDGARVLMADIDAAIEAAAQDLGQPYIRSDIASGDGRAALMAKADEMFDSLDILVNNAGVLRKATLLELTEEDYELVMGVNAKAALFMTQAAARRMVTQRRGAIINISSVNALLAIPDQIPYSISKGAVRQLTNVTALALAPYGVRVNAVGPGTIRTAMVAQAAGPDAQALVLSRTPLRRMGEPEEIAAVVSFLASDEASYITGQTIYADGGRLGLNYHALPAAG